MFDKRTANLNRGMDLGGFITVKAARLLAENILALLRVRHLSQHDLAQWCHHSDPWLSAILTGKREAQFSDLDRIADFFGLATYQLFQPGISGVTERRSGQDRRKGQDRRISHVTRQMIRLESELAPFRPPRKRSIKE